MLWLWYLLIALLPAAAVIYVVWAHRKRATAQSAASSKRFEQIFGSGLQGAAAAPAATGGSGAAAARVSTAPVAAGRATPSYFRKERLLDPRHAVLFRLLVAGLPGYTVFVHVSLAALIELPPSLQGREREQRSRALAQNVLDCLVCSGEMEVVAAVDLEAGDSAESRIKSECLRAAGVRYVRINPAALPGVEEVGRLLLGESR